MGIFRRKLYYDKIDNGLIRGVFENMENVHEIKKIIVNKALGVKQLITAR